MNDVEAAFSPYLLDQPLASVIPTQITQLIILNVDTSTPDDNEIYVVWGDATKRVVFLYVLTYSATRTNLPTYTNSQVGNFQFNLIGVPFDDLSTNYIGNKNYMYSPAQNLILDSTGGSWVPYANSVEYTTDPLGVQGYRLHTKRTILSFLTSPTAGKLYYIKPTSVS